MRRELIFVAAAVGAALALPGVSSGQLPATQDSVTGAGGGLWVGRAVRGLRRCRVVA
jgi:hypothetical protein